MEPPMPFLTLVKVVDAEGLTDEKIRTLDKQLEIKTSKLESQIPKTYALNPMI